MNESAFWWESTPLTRIAPTAPFLVFADAPGYPGAKHKHPTRSAAEAEARRLSSLNPGVNYYVLGSLSVTSLPKAQPVTRNLVA